MVPERLVCGMCFVSRAPLVSQGTPRTDGGAPYDPRFNSHKTSRRPATRSAPPLRGRRVAFAVAMHKSNHPPAPGVKSKTCVLHHTLVFRWNDGQKFALPSGAPLASRPGMWPASQPCTACSASDRAGVRSWHYCQAGRQPSAARVCSARRFIMRHARALCDSDRILGFTVSGRQPRAVGSCWRALYTRMGFLDGWRRVRVGAVGR